MSNLFEETGNQNPPSPSLDLLDSSQIKTDLDSNRKLPIQNNVAGQGNRTFAFGSEGDQISENVRVVHVQEEPTSGQPTQTNPVTIYAVGGSGHQIQQVIAPSEGNSSMTTVTVDPNSTDGNRYTYYPTVQTSDANQQAGQQFYVMMSPQEVIPGAGQRIIAPRAQTLNPKVEAMRSSRDERRRATHNEVERRRRDKINTWIMKLAALVPDCQMDQSKQGTSKGGVLSKTLDHIIKLRTQNERMAETIKEQERILVENQVLRQQVEKLRQENAILQASLQLRQNTEQLEHERKLDTD